MVPTCLVHEIIEDAECPLCLAPHIDPELDVEAFLDRVYTLARAS